MNRLLSTAEQCGMDDVVKAPTGASEPAAKIGVAMLTWAVDLARTKLPRGYTRPEHAFAITYALGLFYGTVALAGRVSTDALLSARDATLATQQIDPIVETAAELSLFDDIMHRAADLALHGRNPGKALTDKLMRYSLLGILEVPETEPTAQVMLARMAQCIAEMDAAVQTN